jgi:hypothetical protein
VGSKRSASQAFFPLRTSDYIPFENFIVLIHLERRKPMKKTVTLGIILGGIAMLSPTVSLSQTAYGNYKGRLINLTQSWEGAKACVVASGRVNCFDSYAEADKFTGSSDRAQAGTPTTASCTPNGYTYVYEDADFRGRRLQFRDNGYWQGYDTYGFRNKQSSWSNPRCYSVWLKDIDTNPDSYYIEGANSSSRNMGSWNNRADEIYLMPNK